MWTRPREMVSTYSDLRMRIVAVLLSCGVALIAALAYNLGGIAISDKLARRMMEDEKSLRVCALPCVSHTAVLPPPPQHNNDNNNNSRASVSFRHAKRHYER